MSAILSRLQAASTKKTLVGAAVAILLLGVLIYVLMPFRAAGDLECGAALFGAKPNRDTAQGLVLGREDQFCQSAANSRLIIAGVATLAALAVGIGAAVLPEGQFERVLLYGEDPLAGSPQAGPSPGPPGPPAPEQSAGPPSRPWSQSGRPGP